MIGTSDRLIGPSLLVLVFIFATDKLLLMKRGQPPYEGKWAPPGGFVEAGESLEAAAVREVEEEVGIKLLQEQLLPQGMGSIPALNQIYVSFVAPLEQAVTPAPMLPEALDAQWFSEADYTRLNMWDPAIGFNMGQIYTNVRNRRFEFYQHIDKRLRIITSEHAIKYVWRNL